MSNVWMHRVVFFVAGVMFALGMLLVAGVIAGPSVSGDSGHYRVYAEFADVGTLSPGARVALSGVTIGRVVDIELDTSTYRARVAMDIQSRVDNIAIDSTAVILTAGLVGEHYISISPGGHPDSIPDKGYIEDTQSAISVESLIMRGLTGY